MTKRRRKEPNQTPQKAKPKKTFWDSFRKFLAKNRDILVLLGVIFTAATLFFGIYFHFSSAQTTPQTQPKSRFEIEQPAPTIPVQPVDGECPSRPV